MRNELDRDLPAYLVFLILGHVKALEEQAPDHILVKAVRDALDQVPRENPAQLSLGLGFYD